MPTYRVKMNNTTTTDDRMPSRISYRHLESSDITAAKQDAEKLFFGQCEDVMEKPLASKVIFVNNMVDDTSYEILADSSFTNDTVLFKKQGNIIYSTIRGGEFPEEGFTKWYDLSIIKLLGNTKDLDQSNLNLEDLEWIDFEVYNEISVLKEIPVEFVELYGEI